MTGFANPTHNIACNTLPCSFTRMGLPALMMLGGGIIIISTLAFFFWGVVGLASGSMHTLLLAASSIPAAIVGVAIAGLGSGGLLRAVQNRMVVMRAEDAARQAAARPSEPIRMLPRP